MKQVGVTVRASTDLAHVQVSKTSDENMNAKTSGEKPKAKTSDEKMKAKKSDEKNESRNEC